jgi:cytochrome c oxidase subunit 1
VRFNTPMLWAMGFIVLFTIGGLTGLFLGALATDIPLTHTYFIVAHFHYVMMGSTLFAFMAGMYYWWPKMFGRMYDEKLGALGFWLAFIGFNLAFFPQFVAGSQGMPRRYASYPPGPIMHYFGMNIPTFIAAHRMSTVGAYTLGAGLFVALVSWIISLAHGKRAAANPWGSNTLEWHTPSPPPHDNFSYTPVAGDPYDLHRWKYDPSIDGWILKDQSEL